MSGPTCGGGCDRHAADDPRWLDGHACPLAQSERTEHLERRLGVLEHLAANPPLRRRDIIAGAFGEALAHLRRIIAATRRQLAQR